MKYFVFCFLTVFISASALSQDMTKFKLYNTSADASMQIDEAVKKAKASGKHVFIQVGGNWCVWCARFDNFITTDKTIDSLVKANYIVYHLNYSKENYNKPILAKYGYPQRFGFPVFLVVNGDGQLIHTQNSVYLEEGKGYNKERVIEFFRHWTASALDPGQYKDQ